MKIGNIILASTVLLSIVLISCTKKNTETKERFYFRNDGADIAVQIDGNIASKTFILLLHGGPGGGSAAYNSGCYADELEKNMPWCIWTKEGMVHNKETTINLLLPWSKIQKMFTR